MSDAVTSRTMRADNYALSEETKRLRDEEQARLTDDAYEEALRLLAKHRAAARPDRRGAAREGDARAATRCSELLADVEPESRASETVGVPRVVASTPSDALPASSSRRPAVSFEMSTGVASAAVSDTCGSSRRT